MFFSFGSHSSCVMCAPFCPSADKICEIWKSDMDKYGLKPIRTKRDDLVQSRYELLCSVLCCALRIVVDVLRRLVDVFLPHCYLCLDRFVPSAAEENSKLCPKCAEFNRSKREVNADLSDRVALITGARIKIGYATALSLLRCGAVVVGITRFPRDAAERYRAEPDFAEWKVS
jgi:hypothetical protein